MLGHKLIVVLLDNRGFGCINRLQMACGGAELQQPDRHRPPRRRPSAIDFAAHAASMGATAEKVGSIAELEQAMAARPRQRPQLRRASSTPIRSPTTAAGGHWWDVAVPEVSGRAEVAAARQKYEAHRELQRQD